MNIDNELLPQQETLQTTTSNKEKRKNSWKAFTILLIIFNSPLVAGLITGLISVSIYTAVPLAIIDFIAVRSYIKKRGPPWILFLIILLFVNVVFFVLAGWGLSQTAGGVAAILIAIIALCLLLFDTIAIMCYIKRTR